MRHFMREQRDEEKQRRQNGERPDHVRAPLFVARLELRAQGHGDQQRDKEPTVVETDFDTEDPSKPNARSHPAPLFIRTTTGGDPEAWHSRSETLVSCESPSPRQPPGRRAGEPSYNEASSRDNVWPDAQHAMYAPPRGPWKAR